MTTTVSGVAILAGSIATILIENQVSNVSPQTNSITLSVDISQG
jgi:hypothetical protein